MTVINAGDAIAIRHVHVGFTSDVIDIQDMSMELALWLEAMLVVEKGENIKLNDVIGSMALTPPDWVLRARLAAFKAFKPPYATRGGRLTELGEHYSLIVNRILNQIRDIDYGSISSDKWTRIDEMIITATFPKRAGKLLSVIDRAVSDAIKNHESGADEIVARFNRDNPPPPPEKPKLMDVFSHNEEGHNRSDFKTELVEEKEATTCWVKTSTFSAKAKYDLNVLMKFGLVDYRHLATGAQGRPKGVIKIADLGTRFLKDLEDRSLL